MKYKLLGRSGLRVSELSLGTMTFGTEWGWGSTKAESRKVFDAFVKRGGNFLDTANKYTEGTSEKYVGEFVAKERDSFVVATKYTLTMDPADPNASGNHRKNMVRSVEASLKRLKTDFIDLLWLHAWDYHTPVEEVMRALDDLVRAGKVHYVGNSDTPAWIVSRANTLAEWKGWSPFVALQVEYSLVERTVERELLPMARSLDLAVTPWSPLGAGLLTGKFTRKKRSGKARLTEKSDKMNERNLAIAKAVDEVADEVGKPSAQVAINWVRGGRGVMIPIVGARTAAQLKENMGYLDWTLDGEHLAKLDEASAIDPGFPHRFLNKDIIKKHVMGEKHDHIESHRKEWLP